MTIIETFEKALQDAINYPVEVKPSHDEEEYLCAFVYAVEKDDMTQVRELIFKIEDEVLAGTQYICMPMVKSLEVTSQHYPSKLPKVDRNIAWVLGSGSSPIIALGKSVDECAHEIGPEFNFCSNMPIGTGTKQARCLIEADEAFALAS